MRIEIEKSSGFCFGVENAISMAEEALKSGEKVYCLGQIVHNELEVDRLRSFGLITVDHKKFSELRDCKVLIRAHGEPPETYKIAEENQIEIIEATCPIVKKLQSRVESAWSGTDSGDGQVAIYGKSGHAEVKGLLGQARGDALLIGNIKDLQKIDYSRRLSLFSQTTMSKSEYKKIIEKIKENYRSQGENPLTMVKIANSICGQVANREPAVKAFAVNHDVVLFVSGKNSSNGKMLYEVCKEVNSSSYFITSFKEVDPEWFAGKSSVGICGATSTPRWLIKEISEKLKESIS